LGVGWRCEKGDTGATHVNGFEIGLFYCTAHNKFQLGLLISYRAKERQDCSCELNCISVKGREQF